MTERHILHKELQKIKRRGHYYVADILNFILAREKEHWHKCNRPECETCNGEGAGEFGKHPLLPLEVTKVAQWLQDAIGLYADEALDSAHDFCSKFAQQKERELPSEDEILNAMRPIPSTHVPISQINGKTYYYMCKEDVAKSIVALMQGGKE